MNKCFFTGRLVRDAVYKDTNQDNSKPTLAFSLAINNGYGDKVNTVYIDCITTGKLADIFKDRLYKGIKVLVEAYLYSYDWTTKDGVVRHEKALYIKSCEIVAHTKAYLDEHKKDGAKLISGVDTEQNEKYYTVWSKTLGEIKEDEDGFMIFDDEDIDLPFDM